MEAPPLPTLSPGATVSQQPQTWTVMSACGISLDLLDPVQSNIFLLVLSSTANLVFGPPSGPMTILFVLLRLSRVLIWILLFDGWRGLTNTGHYFSTGE
jgi:hypothetical protein